jgi:hypothetical protein
MSQPEENREKSAKTDAVLSPRELRHPPTANPARTQVQPEAVEPEREEGEPESPGAREEER